MTFLFRVFIETCASANIYRRIDLIVKAFYESMHPVRLAIKNKYWYSGENLCLRQHLIIKIIVHKVNLLKLIKNKKN